MIMLIIICLLMKIIFTFYNISVKKPKANSAILSVAEQDLRVLASPPHKTRPLYMAFGHSQLLDCSNLFEHRPKQLLPFPVHLVL